MIYISKICHLLRVCFRIHNKHNPAFVVDLTVYIVAFIQRIFFVFQRIFFVFQRIFFILQCIFFISFLSHIAGIHIPGIHIF